MADDQHDQPNERVHITAQEARQIARHEIASLAGLVLRRAQEVQLTRSIEGNVAREAFHEEMSEIFGEVLRDFTTLAEPGNDEGGEDGS